MQNYSLELNAKIEYVLRTNALLLYNQSDEPANFSYERHICSSINEIPGKSLPVKVKNSIIIALNLWLCWEIHTKHSSYPFEWYGCVQVDEQWIHQGIGTPPYVVFDSEEPSKIREYQAFQSVSIEEFPLKMDFKVIMKGTEIRLKKAIFREDSMTVWRFYS